jgi:hypothetical protein
MKSIKNLLSEGYLLHTASLSMIIAYPQRREKSFFCFFFLERERKRKIYDAELCAHMWKNVM